VRRLSPDRDLERSSALLETSEGRERLVRLFYHTVDETSVLHHSGPGLQPTHSLLSYETTWITNAAKLRD
jgi:hypothetical protein